MGWSGAVPTSLTDPITPDHDYPVPQSSFADVRILARVYSRLVIGGKKERKKGQESKEKCDCEIGKNEKQKKKNGKTIENSFDEYRARDI